MVVLYTHCAFLTLFSTQIIILKCIECLFFYFEEIFETNTLNARSQFAKAESSKQWAEFKSVPKAMEGIIRMYENYLQKINPGIKNITYDIKNLFNYVDRLPECAAMVKDKGVFVPRGKTWVKEQLYSKLVNEGSAGKRQQQKRRGGGRRR